MRFSPLCKARWAPRSWQRAHSIIPQLLNTATRLLLILVCSGRFVVGFSVPNTMESIRYIPVHIGQRLLPMFKSHGQHIWHVLCILQWRIGSYDVTVPKGCRYFVCILARKTTIFAQAPTLTSGCRTRPKPIPRIQNLCKTLRNLITNELMRWVSSRL
jgi:hypothetical protein